MFWAYREKDLGIGNVLAGFGCREVQESTLLG